MSEQRNIVEQARMIQERAKAIGETSFPDTLDEFAQAVLDLAKTLDQVIWHEPGNIQAEIARRAFKKWGIKSEYDEDHSL